MQREVQKMSAGLTPETEKEVEIYLLMLQNQCLSAQVVLSLVWQSNTLGVAYYDLDCPQVCYMPDRPEMDDFVLLQQSEKCPCHSYLCPSLLLTLKCVCVCVCICVYVCVGACPHSCVCV